MSRWWVLATLALWPVVDAAAAGPEKVHRVGMLCAGSVGAAEAQAFVAEMAKLGFVEGKNLVLERSENSSMQASELAATAATLAARRVDVITTWCGTSGALAAKSAARSVGVVFNGSADPVGLGLVESLARPGGNMTGFSGQVLDLAGKQLEALAQVKPNLKKLAVVHHASSLELPWYPNFRAALERAGRTLQLPVQIVSVADTAQLDATLAQLVKEGVGGVYVLSGIRTPRAFLDRAAALALQHRLPSSGGVDPRRPGLGMLLGMRANEGESGRRMARAVGKLLAGTPAGELPVEQIEPPGLSIDLRVAKAIGLTIPHSLLVRATEVIE